MLVIYNMLVTFSIVFIILTLLYLVLSHKQVNYIDISIICVSLVILALTILKTKGIVEFYEDAAPSTTVSNDSMSLMKLQPISMQEDFQPIASVASLYISVHHDTSYPGSGKEMYNLAFDPKKANSCPNGSNRVLTFENTPAISRANGITMNTNRIRGPLSSALNIDLQATFTIFFTCVHGNFVPNTDQVELFKLYANSNNNNGLVMFIPNTPTERIVVGADTQSAEIHIQYTDEDVKKCTVSDSSRITFPKTNMMTYFIVKDVDTLKVYSMEGSSTTLSSLLSSTIMETTANFSNKELVINRFRNYRGSIYQFGIIPKALSVEDISKVHEHCYNYYQRAKSVEFLSLSKNYNQMLEFLKNVKGCPYDTSTCQACDTITDWTNTSQLVSASAGCRQAIDTFCKANPTHFRCRCWNTSIAEYNTTSCKLWRGIFTPDKSMLDNLSQDELNYIKTKYALLRPEDCPKPVIPETSCVNEKLIKNSYSEYDYNKIKIDPTTFSNKAVPPTLQTPYGRSDDKTFADKRKAIAAASSNGQLPLKEKREAESKQSSKESSSEYMYKNITLDIKEDSAMPNKDKLHDYKVPTSTSPSPDLMNLYQTDPNVKFDQSGNVAFAEIEKTNKIETEQTTPFMKSLNSMFFGGL